MENLPLFTGFYLSQVVSRISSIKSIIPNTTCPFQAQVFHFIILSQLGGQLHLRNGCGYDGSQKVWDKFPNVTGMRP